MWQNKKNPLMCVYNGRRAAVLAAPNDTELFIVFPKDLMINKGQSYSVRRVSVLLLMFNGCGRKQQTHMCCIEVFKCTKEHFG